MLLKRLNTQIAKRRCLICYKELQNGFFQLFSDAQICPTCLKELKPVWGKVTLENIKGRYLYFYKEKIKELIYQYKGCYDRVLASVFLYPYRWLIRSIYKNYVLVPIPSYYLHDQKRGFNHVLEMIKPLGLPICNCLEKTCDIKQSSLSKEQRKNMDQRIILLKNAEELKDKNVLIVDDVLTTGSTIMYCEKLIKTAKSRHICFLVLAYTCREKGEFDE